MSWFGSEGKENDAVEGRHSRRRVLAQTRWCDDDDGDDCLDAEARVRKGAGVSFCLRYTNSSIPRGRRLRGAWCVVQVAPGAAVRNGSRDH